MPTLQELSARFVKHYVDLADKYHGRKRPDGTTQWGGFLVDVIDHVDTLAEADGIWFDCPLCYAKQGEHRGVHGILIWFAGRAAPDRLGKNKAGATVRWNIAAGTGINDLSLMPSIQVVYGCMWHGFVGSNGVPPGHAQ